MAMNTFDNIIEELINFVMKGIGNNFIPLKILLKVLL